MTGPSIESLIRSEVQAAVLEVLEPHLPKLSRPDCRSYTFRQAALVIGCSDRHVAKLVARGVLPLVPELGTRKLIPRVAVEAFVDGVEASAQSKLGGADRADVSQISGRAS